MTLKRTPLYPAHVRLGGRLVEFSGWEMPVQYTSIIEEHHAVRAAAGLFDISHMGQCLVSGPNALAFLNQVLTNDLRKIQPGQGQYTLMCNDQGGVIDDLYVYCLGDQDYWLVVNASRAEADVAWLERQRAQLFQDQGVALECLLAKYGALAVQGPRAVEFVGPVFFEGGKDGAAAARIRSLKKNQIADFRFAAASVWVARTGYTGEDGFEIIAPNDILDGLWQQLLWAGKPYGLKPAGLGARDTLRTEAGYSLYGHELDEQSTPIEAGLDRFVGLLKPSFIGRDVLARQQANGVTKKGISFKMVEKSPPPRPHYPVWNIADAAAQIGVVTSGTQSPSLGVGIGMAYVHPFFAQPGTPIAIEIRGKRMAAHVVARPTYRRQHA
jgi:aminomethyltransferase